MTQPDNQEIGRDEGLALDWTDDHGMHSMWVQ